ncbi:MAG: RDD family protein [Candidatus Hodarchaeales archaeon]|jgi:uncharacterized RDD family membrane protein YckC
MTTIVEEKELERYLEQIGKFFPYSQSNNKQALDSLRIEIEDVIQDSKELPLEELFGAPIKVAKNFSVNYEWNTHPAGVWVRLGAYLIDLSLGLWLSVVWNGTLTTFFNAFIEQNQNVLFHRNYRNLTTLIYIFFVLTQLIGLWIVTMYHSLLLEGYISTTVGKKVYGLLVCDTTGIRITWEQTTIRNLSKLIPGLLMLECLLVRRQKRKDTDHFHRQLDLLANTMVVQKEHTRPYEKAVLVLTVLFFLFSVYTVLGWWDVIL